MGRSSRWQRYGTLAACIGLVLLTLSAYFRLWENDFIDLDDTSYIVENPHVLGGLTRPDVAWAWTTFEGGYWQPLTWMSLQLDASLFYHRLAGPLALPLAAGIHAVNLIWHIATTVLLFLVLRRITGRAAPSFVVAGLFAVHPLHVESVAWACERKDTLSTFFLVLTIGLYARFVEAPRPGTYLLAMLSFALGLLAKPMLVTLPCALLLLDYWPLQRLGNPARPTSLARLLLEKVPLLALAAASSIVTWHAQSKGGAILTLAELPAPIRLAHALVSYGWYLEKTFWPTGLIIIWPHSRHMPDTVSIVIASVILATVTAAALVSRRTWPWFLVGWLWFLGTLFPVIGLFQAGDQAVADRFSYVPHIGLFIAIVWSAAALLSRCHIPAPAQGGLAAAALATLVCLTVGQVSYWRNTKTIWAHAANVAPDNHRVHCHLGLYLLSNAGPAAASEELRESVRLMPDNMDYRRMLAYFLFLQGDWDAADEQCSAMLKRDRLEPHYRADALFRLGEIRMGQERFTDAVDCLERSLQLRPLAAPTLAALGNALWKSSRAPEAAARWQEALRVNPGEPEALVGQGRIDLRAGRARQAATQFVAAMSSFNPEAMSLLGAALGRMGKWPEAIKAQETAIQQERARLHGQVRADQKSLACYYRRLGAALQGAGNKDAARQALAESNRLAPHGSRDDDLDNGSSGK